MSRGAYRSVYAAIFDHPDFQRLTPEARLTLLTVRQCPQAGPAAIFRYYVELLARQTGLKVIRVRMALRHLAEEPSPDDPWIMIDEVVVWVRNALRHEPLFRLSDPKHLKFIVRTLEGLPRTKTVLSFCEHYNLPRPFEDPSMGLRCTEPSTEPFPEAKGLLNSLREGSAAEPSLLTPHDSPTKPDELDTPEGVLRWLNEKTGRHYRPVKINLDLIRHRLKDGISAAQLRAIVTRKTREWGGDSKMSKFLRPVTLFSKTHAEQYLGEL